MNENEKYIQYEVTIEPVFIPRQGRQIDEFRQVIINVYAQNINDAIEKAKSLVNVVPSKLEVVSVMTMGMACRSRG